MVTQCVLCSLYSPVRWSVTLHSTNGWERFKNKNHFNLNKWVPHHTSVGTSGQGAELDVKGPGGIITSAEEESLKTDRVNMTDNRADNF